jgi:integrase
MADVRTWRELLQDEGRAGKTVNNYVKDVGAAYRAAIREGLVSFNPCSALEAVSTEDSLERKPFTVDEVAVLLGAAETTEWRGVILIAAFTGLRLGDAARLKWESIDLDKRLISLMPSKTKRKKRMVTIPLQPDLYAFLREQPRTKVQPFVLPELAGKMINGNHGLSLQFNNLMARAGIDRGKASRETTASEGNGKGRVVHERGFHSLRHTFTSWLRTAGVSEEDRMALTGHSTRESHAIYSHTTAEALRLAIDKLPNLEKAA